MQTTCQADFPIILVATRRGGYLDRMASVFRASGRRKYSVAYRDENGRRRVVPGFVDKRATEALATDLERQAARFATGLAVRRRSTSPADFEKHLLDAGSCVAWAKTCRQRIEKVRAGGVASLDSLSPDTKRRYKQLLASWFEFSGEKLGGSMPDYSRRESSFRRRALTRDELSRLLASSPPNRRLVYLVAAFTGLRRGELRRLCWSDVTEDRVTVYGKAGRVESVPLHESVAQALATRGAGTVFRHIPYRTTVASDYQRAGVAAVPNRVADFHSLRYTFCTMLALAGVNVWEAMKLMRHRDVRLTTRLYLDATQLDVAGAVAKIPALTQEVATR